MQIGADENGAPEAAAAEIGSDQTRAFEIRFGQIGGEEDGVFELAFERSAPTSNAPVKSAPLRLLPDMIRPLRSWNCSCAATAGLAQHELQMGIQDHPQLRVAHALAFRRLVRRHRAPRLPWRASRQVRLPTLAVPDSNT